ncbi:MAG TPA: MBL fold metallo-hydrolase RNA specificity domain-containing protein, partial [Pyrinomonadaceae bacterium]
KVLIAPPGCRRQPMILNIPRTYLIMLTGWAVSRSAPYMYKGVDLVLPLSDHADYDDLVRLARESGARRVITMHGAKKFATLLRELGLDAEHLAQHPSQQKSAKGATKRAAAGAERKLFE